MSDTEVYANTSSLQEDAMKRVLVLVALLAVGSLSLGVAAGQQPPGGAQPGPKVVEVEKLKDNLFVFKGGGGNTAVLVGANGVVVVDTKNPGWGQPILAKIKELTPKPVTTIINTHTHPDHVSGNVEFPAPIEIVTQENTKAGMERMKPAKGYEQLGVTDIFKENNGKGIPTKTFKDRMSLGSGNDRIDLFYFGRGHTNGDAWVVFPALRVMHAGDLFMGKSLPVIDTNNGGSGVAISDTLAKAADSIRNVDTIITGHSTQMTMNDLKEYAQFNRDFLKAVQDGRKAGKSVDEIANTWTVPAKYTGYATPQIDRLKAAVQAIFDELK
jgi:glyoxylase-like metal-dependent hydrolase (beta-lactamase superfamily II)